MEIIMVEIKDGEELAVSSKIKIPFGASLVSAGLPTETLDDSAMFDANKYITKGKAGFKVYKVKDSSVERIKPGSVIFVDTACEPENGNVIAARINDKVTVKIFKRKTNGLFLIPARRDELKKDTPEDGEILGVVKASLQSH